MTTPTDRGEGDERRMFPLMIESGPIIFRGCPFRRHDAALPMFTDGPELLPADPECQQARGGA